MRPDLTWERGGAEFSSDGLYRFKLWRRWDGHQRIGHFVTFVMLNPSTADEKTDDATIRKCIGYAKRWGFNGLDVANLFARISTDPAELAELPYPNGPDGRPVFDILTGGPRCMRALVESINGAARVVAAWGANGDDWPERVDGVSSALRVLGVPLYAFAGATQGGQPLHPGRLAWAHPLVVWGANDPPLVAS
jgi:hypothetical protein